MSRPTAFIPPHELAHMPRDTRVLLALSGGADSCALLHMLLAESTPLAVAHVDHGIRGEESVRDREFCRALAEAHRLPFYLHVADVPALARAHGRGIEEEARRIRYDFFAEVMQREKIPLLATAHHADDNAETLLFRLARGTAARGLCGIPPVRACDGGLVVRPLLRVTRAELEEYCRQHRIDYVTDSTNTCPDYARNRIRHTVLPALQEINAGAVSHMTRLSMTLAAEEDFWQLQVEAVLSAHATDQALTIAPLMSLHPALWARCTAAWLERRGIEPSEKALAEVRKLMTAEKPHAVLHLCGGKLMKENGYLTLWQERPTEDYELPVRKGAQPVLGGEYCLIWETDTEFSPEDHRVCQNIYKKAIKVRLSSDTINGSLFLRPRRPEDTILSGGMHKKVKKLLCDRKIPLAWRDRFPLLCDEKGIVWIPEVALRDGAEGKGGAILTLYSHKNS